MRIDVVRVLFGTEGGTATVKFTEGLPQGAVGAGPFQEYDVAFAVHRHAPPRQSNDEVEYVTLRGGSGGFVQVRFRGPTFDRGVGEIETTHRRRAALLIANIAVNGALENDHVMPPTVVLAH